ncbi:glutamate racemase [Bacteroidota bacterium]
MDNRSIGIFDSGIGGLTITKELNRVLPNESILYFGDTAHLPYGDKSPETIVAYSLAITDFLLENDCKAILIACNSASSTAFDAIVSKVPASMPVFNVIDPVVDYIATRFHAEKVGVIGTRATIGSHVYAQRTREANPSIILVEKSTALLAAMIEEGFHDDEISQAVIQAYLEDNRFEGIKAIVPACTHYPLIAKEIFAYFNKQVEVVDAPGIIARKVKDVLTENDLLANQAKGEMNFMVSDLTPSFQKSAAIFFGDNLKLKEQRL